MIVGFVHISCMGSQWQVVASELFNAISNSKLCNKSDLIHIGIVGTKENFEYLVNAYNSLSNLQFHSFGEEFNQYEYPTLMLLQDEARKYPESKMFYCHSKGVSRDTQDPFTKYWRQYMIKEVILDHQKHISSLDFHNVSGNMWSDGTHFSGNFWWANAAHINTLPLLKELQKNPEIIWDGFDREENIRLQCEQWIGKRKGIKVKEHGILNMKPGFAHRIVQDVNQKEIVCPLDELGFDKIYVINLDRRSDRYQQVLREFDKVGLKGVERFPAIDGATLGITKKDLDNPGIVGCFLSHYSILHEALRKGYKRILVFEDDVSFINGFNEIFRFIYPKVPTDWELLYLGYTERFGVYSFKESINDYVKIPNDPWGTQAYMVQNEGIQKLYDNLKEIKDHIDIQISRTIHPMLKVYEMFPCVCPQSGSNSDISNNTTFKISTKDNAHHLKVKHVVKVQNNKGQLKHEESITDSEQKSEKLEYTPKTNAFVTSDALKVSIVVTARDYGRFVEECLNSCLRQTISPIEVVYSDDCSSDNSVQLAQAIDGVSVVSCNSHTGVAASRNRGVESSTGNLLIHVDGDDILPPNFVEQHLAAMKRDTPFVYGPAKAFGLHESLWEVKPWDKTFIWNMNFVNTSAMIRREVFLAAGKWQESEANTMWDWDLFLRASRFGLPQPSKATLNYRQHDDSWSHQQEYGEYTHRLQLMGIIRKKCVNLSTGCVFSGRLGLTFFEKWVAALASDLETIDKRSELIIVNNSIYETDILLEIIKKYGNAFFKIIIIPNKPIFSWKTEKERRDQVASLMAFSYNCIMDNASGELIHMREDDIILPEGGFNKLFDSITYGYPLTAAIGGLYMNRHPHWPKFVGGWYYPNPTEIDQKPEKDVEVDFTGTGCLIFWKGLCPNKFESHIDGIPAHDWKWGMDLKNKGQKLVLTPEVQAMHFRSELEWV